MARAAFSPSAAGAALSLAWVALVVYVLAWAARRGWLRGMR